MADQSKTETAPAAKPKGGKNGAAGKIEGAEILDLVEEKARIHRLRNGVKSPRIQEALSELDARITKQIDPQVRALSDAWRHRESERKRENKASSTQIPRN